jgi:AmmeMemoRadiSam system protein A
MGDNGSDFLSAEEGKVLLRIARDSLDAYLHGRAIDLERYPLTPALHAKHGAFVTLRVGEELRGCIGHIRDLRPLAETVRDNAINAATRDPRFPPLVAGELPGLRIEVSALYPGEHPDSPFTLVRDIQEIEVGRDGLYLDHTGPRGGGLLLPRVAVEQGWDREQFLEGLCHKAGAPPRAWEQPNVRLYRFAAQVFRE